MAQRGKNLIMRESNSTKWTNMNWREALSLVKETAFAKFDETIDMAVRLGVNPRHADQVVRGGVVLPHGVGKVPRVVVFAKGDKEREAVEAGGDFVGGEDLAQRIADGWLDFDRTAATPDMMAIVGKLGKILVHADSCLIPERARLPSTSAAWFRRLNPAKWNFVLTVPVLFTWASGRSAFLLNPWRKTPAHFWTRWCA